MIPHPALTVLVLLAAGCGQVQDDAQRPEAATSATAQASAPATAVPAPRDGVAARDLAIENELYTLEYSYPAAAGAIPGVRDLLEADLAKRQTDLKAMAEEARHDAAKSGFEYRPYGLWVAWSVVTDLPAWLSLSADVSDYFGGAHPNHGFDALLWDKRAGKMRDVSDLFVSQKAFAQAVRGDFCAALDKERGKRREGFDMEPGLFDDCVDPLDATIILGSSNRKVFNRVGFLVPPYVAGPYAEGAYEVTLPVTDKIMALVKPAYRSSFQPMK